jgi:hypothetical protein
MDIVDSIVMAGAAASEAAAYLQALRKPQFIGDPQANASEEKEFAHA